MKRPPGKPIVPTGQNRGGVAVQVQAEQYSGPVPSPTMLAGYEQVFPGCADRLVAMAEENAVQRRHLDRLDGVAEASRVAKSTTRTMYQWCRDGVVGRGLAAARMARACEPANKLRRLALLEALVGLDD